MKLIRSGLITTVLVLILALGFGNAQGTLWGLTQVGGASNAGSVFSAALDGSGLVIAASFTGVNGANPYFGLSRSGNKYYAVTTFGGANGAGALIEFDRNTGTIIVKHDFIVDASGYHPDGKLAVKGKKIYGTANESTAGSGVLFSYDLSTNTYAVEHTFTDSPDGAIPRSGVQLMSNGKVYGTTSNGGTGGYGTLFEFDPTTSTYLRVGDLASIESGSQPESVPVELRGKLYGTAQFGGDYGTGTLYEYDLTTGLFTKKADFLQSQVGGRPVGELAISPSGVLYGTALQGGSGFGTLYSFDSTTGVLAQNYQFGSQAFLPFGGLTYANGKFYGTVVQSGPNGAIYQFDPGNSSFSILYNMTTSLGTTYETLMYEPPTGLPNVYVAVPADFAKGVAVSPSVKASTVTGATTYEIQLSTSSSFTSGNLPSALGTKSQTFPGLAYNTTYYARVRTNLSPDFGKMTAFTTQRAEPLSYVTIPKDGSTDAAAVKLSVISNLVPGATQYTIELNTDPGFGAGTAKVRSGPNRTISFDSLMFLTTYFTRVKTDIPNSSWGATRSFTTMDASRLSYVISPIKNATRVKWDLDVIAHRVLWADEYTIQLSEDDNFGKVVIEQVADTNVMHFNGLRYGITYYSRVKTNLSAVGVWGEVRSFTTNSPDFSAKLNSPKDGALNVIWSGRLASAVVRGATEYTIEVSEYEDFQDPITMMGPTSAISFLLKPATTYYGHVKTDLLNQWGITTSFTTRSSLPNAYMTIPAHETENVSWLTPISISKVTGATAYDVEVADNIEFNGDVQVQQLTTILKTSFTLEQSKEYFVRVHTDLEEGYGPVRSFTTGSAPSLAYIKTPVNEAVNVILSPKVTVNLVPGAPTKSYTIELNTQEDFQGASVMKAGSSTQTFTNLVGNTTYYARAKTTLSAEWGPVSSFTTLVPEAPPAQPPVGGGPPPAGRVAQHDATDGDAEEESTVRAEEVNFVDSWPNPFTEKFTLRIKSATDSQIKVQMVDMAGRSMHNGLLQPNVEHTFGERWAPGIYLIRVTTGDKVQMEKVVKN